MSVTLKQLQRRIDVTDGAEKGLLKEFAELIFNKASREFLSEFEPETLMAAAVGALRFIEPGEVRVRVYNPTLEENGWKSPYTALELTLEDRPFIVDSVRAELRRRDHKLYHFIHPILSAKRDAAGRVTGVAQKGGEGALEAYELYLIGRINDAEERQALEESVRGVLQDVLLATGDYKKMRHKAHDLHDYLDGLRERSVGEGKEERAEELEEYAAFMNWLDADNYVFLGYRGYDIVHKNDGNPYLQITPESGLGILSKLERSAYHEPVALSDIPESLRERVLGGRVLTVTKTNAESTVHRPARMDYIGIKKMGEDWEVRGEGRFVGLFTSKALSTPVEEIPILRRKLRQVLERDGSPPGSHDFKQIVSIFNSIPREELFWADSGRLFEDIRTVMGEAQERRVRLTVRPDPLARGLAVMVIMPRDRFNSEVRRSIQKFLTDELSASHVDYQLAMGEDEESVRFHFFFTTELDYRNLDLKVLERKVTDLTRTWEDHLRDALRTSQGEAGDALTERYGRALDERYKADTSPQTALRDIKNLEALGEAPYRVDIVNPSDDQKATHLNIYHHQRSLVLTDVLPILENLGFRVLEQISHVAGFPEGERGIDIFRVQTDAGEPVDVEKNGARLEEALRALLAGEAENDRLNRLVLYGGLTLRQTAFLRAYQMHFSQLDAVTSRRFINDTLLAHPAIAGLLVRFFEAKFSPAQEERLEVLEGLEDEFSDSLSTVASLPEDRALRGLFNLIAATVRTNYFLDKPYISFKIDSGEVSNMPEPRPFFEIGVASPHVEGIHLRGGKVARGGIRWSDRPDDFRTEVLGLMKTQMTKNAVIVPVGSKGGFVLKNPPADREALRGFVRAQYQTFIRGLLDLTDNIVEGETVHPEGLVIYDGPDPYLVVAADKGTATFSDLANETAAEYDFWLDDAFASGGSHGYDHKAEGITARGAWVCVERHFRELGVDVHKETFTAYGIGDMSGDVFGNGMLHTETMRLQAAFNHQHIFLDPDPDPVESYAERKRLFALPRSSWEDYDKSLISKGGGVYSRFAKSIPLSESVREMLEVEAEALSGQDLIKAILRMPADLFWNGGIGTYVKSSAERHAEVGDSTNDAVRVDADELRAKVVGEGGNLGFTQLARVEYALAGGRINTDAIDNSGGVDMSDHEVNIKILLRPLYTSGALSFEERNELLKEMTDEVSALVLKDNYMQSLCLSLAQARSESELGLFESLQDYLAERGPLKPAVEFLPSPKTYDERARAGEGLTRPELAILLAYTKMGIYRRLLETNFPDESHFARYLFDYFPEPLQERFPETIRDEHPLRREIIATQFTNKVVDLLGITFVHRSIRDTGASPVEVIRAALVALELLEVDPFIARVFALDNTVPAEAQYGALERLIASVEGIVHWILLSDLSAEPVADFVSAYREPLSTLRAGLPELLPPREREHFEAQAQEVAAQGIPPELAADIVSLDYLPSGVGVIDVSKEASVALEAAARRFYALGDRLRLGWLRDEVAALPSESKWEKIALGGLVTDLRQAQRRLTTRYYEALREGGERTPEAFLEARPRLLQRYDNTLKEIRDQNSLSLASGEVLARLLWQMVEETVREEARELVAAGAA